MSIHYSPKIITDGLVLYLDAGNTKSYPESGSMWYDLSGNNNHFTLLSSIFDNTNGGSLSYGNSIRIYKIGTIFSGDNNLTIIAFFNGNFSIMESTNAGATRNYFQVTSNSAILDQYGPSGAGSRTNLSFASNDGNKIVAHRINSNRTATWFYNGSFTDGGLDETYDSNFGIPEITEIGNRTFNGNSNYYGSAFNGKIRTLLCYNTALTNDQILQNYNAPKGRFGL
jgi:hypothetical protein